MDTKFDTIILALTQQQSTKKQQISSLIWKLANPLLTGAITASSQVLAISDEDMKEAE